MPGSRSQPDIEDRPGLNTDKPWSEMDLFDLANSVRLGDPVEEIASFLCRSRREIREKIAELEQTGELEKRVAKAAAGAKRQREEPPRQSLKERPAVPCRARQQAVGLEQGTATDRRVDAIIGRGSTKEKAPPSPAGFEQSRGRSGPGCAVQQGVDHGARVYASH
jgi:hypothetical protein